MRNRMRICVRTLKKKLTPRIRMRITSAVKSFRIKPERRNRPTNLTLDPQIKEQAIALAQELGYRSLSEWVAELLQNEISRNASLLKTDAVVRVVGERAGRTRKARRVTGR
jgi:hypothetical protein